MSTATLNIGGPPAQPAMVAPEHMIDGPNGSVIADPSKIAPPAEPAKKGDRPAWLPEKFKSPEDLAKAYGELESKLGTKPEAKPEAKPAITPAEAAAKGVDLKALAEEYRTKGALTDATLADLKAKGIDKADVDTYIAGKEAKNQADAAALAEVAGGKDKLTNVLQWAQTNIDPADAKVYNDLIDAGNVQAAKLSLMGIVARYNAAVGSDPALVTANGAPGVTGIEPFTSQAQVVEAMQNPKYSRDPAYRAQVERRLAISFNG
jgi:hypothetical protein